ncbi:dihydroxyacetone kinase subunit L [Clostridium sp. P21]|uniref:phosphoenolpyruvate--glycerone phosphotransferase n=1 Tax=Clostridium muellerianum TaxID=2716538 RepID=A0A7Y0HMZ4_9CLOT|nr:dihydroxyacetone kinase subunit DhaL [Clostridium muellerianum]NMM62670.1 dihydroxyacetone kinase subunit L [Clostridium muellerianum]
MSINTAQVIEILNKITEVMCKNKAFLSELDAAIGDGDHGINMEKGFLAVSDKIKEDDDTTIGDLLKKTGMLLVSNVGGASGPLYGTAFMKAAIEVKDAKTINLNDFLNIMNAALDGIKMRGKAELEDKTMVDAIVPAIESLNESISLNIDDVTALGKAKDSAYNGVLHTKEIIAKKGRASYLGERSIGHQDPGATSSYLMLNTIYEYVKNLSEK